MCAYFQSTKGRKWAIHAAVAALGIILGVLVVAALAKAQESGVSLGELARRERERKASAAKPENVIDLLDLKRDCGADWNCFLAALDEGKPARITFPDTIDATYSRNSAGNSADRSTDAVPPDSPDNPPGEAVNDSEGLAIHSDVILETDKLTQDSAVLSGTTKNTTVLLTDPERARLLLRGYTRDAIDARERRAQEEAKSRDGLFVTCLFQKKSLLEFLENRKEGQFSDHDWELADHCDAPVRPASSNPPGPSAP